MFHISPLSSIDALLLPLEVADLRVKEVARAHPQEKTVLGKFLWIISHACSPIAFCPPSRSAVAPSSPHISGEGQEADQSISAPSKAIPLLPPCPCQSWLPVTFPGTQSGQSCFSPRRTHVNSHTDINAVNSKATRDPVPSFPHLVLYSHLRFAKLPHSP